jgi:hypothetical protein
MQPTDRLSRLMTSKEDKIASLSPPDYEQENFSNSSTDTGDGYVENNGNKLWGISEDWDRSQNAFARDYMDETYALPNESRGDRRSYEYGTKDILGDDGNTQEATVEGYDPAKMGLTSGRFDNSDRRYTPEEDKYGSTYGWDSGPRGVDLNKKKQDVNLDFVAATTKEALLHSSKLALEKRLVRKRTDGYYDYLSPDGYKVIDKKERDSMFGSGSTEYYASHDSVYNDNYSLNDEEKADVIAGIKKAMAITAKRYSRNDPSIVDEGKLSFEESVAAYKDRGSILDKTLRGAGQLASVAVAAPVKGALDLADAVLEAAMFVPQLAVRMAKGDDSYDIDLFNDEFKKSITDSVDSTVGYDRDADNKVMESAFEDIKNAGIDVTSWDSIIDGFTDSEKRANLGEGTLKFLTDPSLTLSMLLEVVGSGLGLGLVAKGGAKLAPKVFDVFKSNATKLKMSVESAQKAGDMAKVRKLEESYNMAQKTVDLLKGSVFTNADMAVRMNRDVTAFRENNEGNAPDTVKLFQIAGLNRLASSAEVMSLKSLVGIKNAPAKVVKEVVEKSIIRSAGKVLAGGFKEGTQEAFDTVVEQLNQKVGSKDWEDKTVVEILSEASAEILTGTIAGAVSGVQLSGLTATTPIIPAAASILLKKVESSRVDNSATKQKGLKEGTTSETTVDELSPEAITKSKSDYKELLLTVAKATKESGVNADNIGLFLEDLETINRTKHIQSTASQAGQDGSEGVYNDVLDSLEKFITENADVKLGKRLVRKTIKESLDEKVLGSGPVDFDDIAEDGSTIPKDKESKFEEVEYDDYSRKVAVESMIRASAGSGRDLSKAFKSKAIKFGATNGMSATGVRDIIKSYESVDVEATSGNRGYKTRLNRLHALTSSSNPIKSSILKERAALDSMYSGIVKSEEALVRGIAGSEKKAAQLNKDTLVTGHLKQFETEYVKDNQEKYKINIKKVDGRWTADVAGAKKLHGMKARYTSDIREGLKELDDRYMPKGKVKVPVKEGNTKKFRKKDVTYLDKITTELDKKIPTNKGISKVILGDTTSSKWKEDGDYYKANAGNINSKSYTSDDVVLINSIGVKKTKNGKSHIALLGKEATLAIRAAKKAGATIVFDSEVATNSKPEFKAALAKHFDLKNHGYTPLTKGDKTVFVKNTEENTKTVKAAVDKEKEEKKAVEGIVRIKARAVSLYRAIDAGLDVKTGELFTDKERAATVKEYNTLRAALLVKTFSGEDKLDNYLKRESADSVSKAASAILSDAKATPLSYDDAVFEKDVATFIKGEEQKDVDGRAMFAGWKAVTELGLGSKERETEVANVIEAVTPSLQPKNLIEEILGERSFVKGKSDLYEAVYQNVVNKQISAVPLRKPMHPAKYADFMAKNNEPGAHTISNVKGKFVFLGSRRVVQDVTKIVSVSKTTVANSLPLDFLPFKVRKMVKSFTKNAKSTLAKVSPAEKAEQTYSVDDNGNRLVGGFNLHNSPARGLFFDKEGRLNEEVMTATYLALGDMLLSDKTALSIGAKSDHDVATMFNVQQFELTNEMREFAYAHGSLLKTVANKLGKNVMTQLGLSKVIDSDTSSGEYDSLISDIGNTALLIAEKEGLLQNTTVGSNKVAELYHDGEQRDVETDTHFINLAGVESEEFGYVRNVPTMQVETFMDDYDVAVKNFPEASTTRKGGNFFKPNSETVDKALTTVRNDISGKEQPKDAQTATKILMETAYHPDLARIDEILEADKDGAVKKLMGFIEVSDYEKDILIPEFEALYFKDKEVQEAKNNAIVKTLDELATLKLEILDRGNKSTDMYFDYFYASNDRYMMDANTINPQVDKLHRFLITPKDHRLDYKVETKNGGTTFEVDGEDQSFVVRMAISQAFGQGIDKMNADDIINYGNVMLSMSKNDIASARKEIFSHGKLIVQSDGKDYKVEAEHLSHTLQALNFLEEAQDALVNGTPLTSSLSLEFDSLTSGFANKTQQMPIFEYKSMVQHFARTGVITREYQQHLKDSLNYKGEGVEFDPKTGQSVADIIADDDKFLDSYKNMANTTILKLRENIVQKENLSHASVDGGVSGFAIFEAIKPMLPGGESITSDGEVTITSLIRNLFKNPFMIFNYSAGIARIVKNLGNDVAHDLAKTIATKDFTLEKNFGTEKIAQNLVDTVDLINPGTKEIIGSALELQDILRHHKLVKIKVATPFMVESKDYGKEKKAVESKNLEELFENVMRATYGEVVNEVFNEEFKPFMDVQDAMNDTFKIAFRIFDKKRVDMLKKTQKEKEDSFLSVKDHMDVLEKLRDDFPWIVGPLTEGSDNKSVISIVTTTTRSSNPLEEARKKPQAVLEDGTTRTVTPLTKYLEEAVSSGSVLPFHAIDGAEIAKTLIAMGMNSIAAIHDAVIAPLNESDNVGFAYQKGMVETNTTYVLADALSGLVKRMDKTMSDPKFAEDFKDTTSKGIKLFSQVKEDIPFPEVAKAVANKMTFEVDNILEKRKEWYGKGGKLEGAYYGNLVGTPGGVYRTAYTDENNVLHPASTEADLSYKEEFKRLGKYKTPTVNVVSTVVDKSSEVTGHITTNKAILKEVEHKLGLGIGKSTYGDMFEILSNDSAKAEELVKMFKNKLKAYIQPKTKADIESVLEELSLFTGDATIAENAVVELDPVVETTSSKSAKFSVSNEVKQKLDC